MRTYSVLLLGLTCLLCGCKLRYPVAGSSGKEDVAYLLFVSQESYAGQTLAVTLDGAASFEAKAVGARKAGRKGKAYAVKPGRRTIRVTSGTRPLYEKELFLSPQETKIITLP